MLLGAHMPTKGKLVNGILSGAEIGCEVVQIFTKSPQQWKSRPLKPEEIEEFRQKAQELLKGPPIAHDSYLINLASANPEILEKSQIAFLEEMERSEQLGISYLVTHMGTCGDSPEEEAIRRLVESLNWIHQKTPGFKVQITLETTAGQGRSIGYRLEHFPRILDQVESPERLAICIDTCHIFVAGYDIRTPEGLSDFLEKFDKVVGLSRLKVIHANDAKKELGSRVDRHAHIGEGFLGKEAFRALLHEPRLQNLMVILETPEAETMHAENLRRLRELAGPSA